MAHSAPLVLVTRPKAASERFARALLARRKAEVLIAPVIETKPLGPRVDIPKDASVVFTSAQAVLRARSRNRQTAYCVGAATAKAAERAGFHAISAEGTSDNLISMLLQDRPAGRIFYLRGEEAVGDVARHLLDAGLAVEEKIVYRQVDKPISPGTMAAIENASGVLAPVFSARSAMRLSEEIPADRPITLIAISPSVATAWPRNADNVTAAKSPTLVSMVAAVVKALDSDSQCSP
ncbi:MAG: uroporphyrinogen-III synthase [Pseudomonadota bacterium]